MCHYLCMREGPSFPRSSPRAWGGRTKLKETSASLKETSETGDTQQSLCVYPLQMQVQRTLVEIFNSLLIILLQIWLLLYSIMNLVTIQSMNFVLNFYLAYYQVPGTQRAILSLLHYPLGYSDPLMSNCSQQTSLCDFLHLSDSRSSQLRLGREHSLLDFFSFWACFNVVK